jgi:translation elongation factor EF-Tu-like GTPase
MKRVLIVDKLRDINIELSDLLYEADREFNDLPLDNTSYKIAEDNRFHYDAAIEHLAKAVHALEQVKEV